MKIWRKSRLSECHANLFANGRVRAIYVNIFVMGEAYTIEQRVNDVWTILPIKPRKDGAVYAFNDIGYELAPHSTRLFTIHVEPDKYDFERGQEYRIVKEFFKKGKRVPQSVYFYFSFE